VACANELRTRLVPAKMEQVCSMQHLLCTDEDLTLTGCLQGRHFDCLCIQVIMSDKTTLSLRLRTAQGSSWLTVCWHPVAARVSLTIDWHYLMVHSSPSSARADSMC
jgi:hypothetical protein